MTLTRAYGPPPYYPQEPSISLAPAFDTGLLMDSALESAAMIGLVNVDGGGSKDIVTVGLSFGTVDKSSGTTTCRISLQDVDTATGPVARPDGGVDQSYTIANADAGWVSNAWYQATLGAARTVANGALLAVVVDFPAYGGTDSTIIRGLDTRGAIPWHHCQSSLLTASWAIRSQCMPNVVFGFSDGTFGTFRGAFPASALNSTAHNSGSATDEHALRFRLPWECKCDGAWILVSPAAGADFNVLLSDASGTTLAGFSAVAKDQNTVASASARAIHAVWAPITLAADTTYYLSVPPTTANNLTIYTHSVAAAGHMQALQGGAEMYSGSRVNGGSWTDVTTSRLFAGLSLQSLHAGGGGGPLILP